MSFVKDVAQKLGLRKPSVHAESASDKRTASTNENATALPNSYDLTVESPEPKSPAPKLRSLEDIVKRKVAEKVEHIERRQKVADQENRTKNTSIPKSSAQSQTALSSTRNRDDRYSTQGDKPSSNERRALGLPEKKPRDAVTVAIPTSPLNTSNLPTLDMAPAPRRIPSHRPFRPLDTLDIKPRKKSQQADFYERKMGISTSQCSPKDLKAQTVKRYKSSEKINASNVRANDHKIPNKRPRVDSSPLEGTARHHAINVEESRERLPLSQLQTSAQTNYAALSDDQWPVGERLLASPILLDERSRDQNSVVARSAQKVPGPPYDQSEDELHEERTEKFNKIARAQRLEERSLGHDAESLNHSSSVKLRQLDEMLDSSSSSINHQPSTSGYFANALPANNISKQVRPREESPDELQSGTYMVDKTPSRQKVSLPHQSASSIANLINASARRPTEESRPSKFKDKETRYPLKSVIYPELARTNAYRLVLNHTKKSFRVEEDGTFLGAHVFDLALSKIIKIGFTNGGEKVTVHLSGGVSPVNYVPLEFSSPKSCSDFVLAVQSLMYDIKVTVKEEAYMEKVFKNGPKRMEEFSAHAMTKSPRRRSDDLKLFPTIRDERKLSLVKHGRLVDNLDVPLNATAVAPSSTVITGADRAGQNGGHVARKRSPPSTSDKPRDMTDDHKTSRTARTARTTRSQAGNAIESTLSRPDVYKDRTPWKQPLVYPANGKNCATIFYDDLKRLNDDEFLNDNLVGLFLRYLQEHATPDAMKRMHFFNSFFFEALTKERKTKGGINYEAVSKWTKKINIFKRDFVVVPVNENLHWFVMIICNLPRLKKAHTLDDQEEETDDIEEIAPPDMICDEKTILSSDLPLTSEIAARESFQDMSLDENMKQISPTVQKKERRKKFKRSLPKYDIDAPVIITLDSLDQPRSGTATALRSYIQALAADERQAHQAFQIDAKAEIKGMTGKGIPHQTNFSDCGLYLCMYLEQFMTDPTKFIQRILRREESGQGWPGHIESGTLRDRLLDMVVELQKEQESKAVYYAKIPPIGSILVSMQTEEMNDKHRRIMIAKAHYARYKESEEIEVLTSPPRRTVRKQPESIHAVEQLRPSAFENDADNPAIIIDEDDLSHQADSTSRYFRETTDHPSQEILRDNTIHVVQLDTPGNMAARIRRERSPEEGVTESESASEITSGRRRRHESVSTDFLSGDGSFQIDEFPEVQNLKVPSEASKLSKDDRDESRSDRIGRTPGDAHGHGRPIDDGLDIMHDMLFENTAGT